MSGSQFIPLKTASARIRLVHFRVKDQAQLCYILVNTHVFPIRSRNSVKIGGIPSS